MTGKLKPYPAMKDSGVPWLGEVPDHWEVLAALAVYKPRLLKNLGMLEKRVLSLSYGRIIVKAEEKLRGLVPESFETYQIVAPGNIIVRTTDLQNDKNSLRVGHSKNHGIITAAYMCLDTTDRVSNEFGYQFLNAYDLLKIIYSFGSGLRQNLDFSDIKRMPVLVPPLSEQAAIVRFLDHADRRIRRYIRAKQKLVKLLEEQKQAIIHRAITRGLDPNVRLKPSGVEWLGEVPEHWEEKRLKYVSPEITVGVVVNPSSYFVNDGVPMLLGNNVLPGRFKLHNVRRISPESNRALRKSQLHAGDVVVVRVGAPGVAAVVPDELEGCNCASMVILRRGKEVEPRWVEHLFNSPVMGQQIDVVKYGAAQKQFNIAHAVEFLAMVPRLEEQREILSYLARELDPLDLAASRITSEIPLLGEYRARLIADVVTGKLDVREAAARLPDEAEEPEPLDEVEGVAEDGENGEGADLEAVPAEAEV